MGEFDEWLGVAGAAGSPRYCWWQVRASRWRQARPDAVKSPTNSSAGPKYRIPASDARHTSSSAESTAAGICAIIAAMSDDQPPEVLSALPRTRPHRRSQKRAGSAVRPPSPDPEPVATAPSPPAAPELPATAATGSAGATTDPSPPASAPPPVAGLPHPRPLRQPAQPKGVPTTPRQPHPAPPSGADIFDTAVQAAAELAEIGLTITARAIRHAIARLPRP